MLTCSVHAVRKTLVFVLRRTAHCCRAVERSFAETGPLLRRHSRDTGSRHQPLVTLAGVWETTSAAQLSTEVAVFRKVVKVCQLQEHCKSQTGRPDRSERQPQQLVLQLSLSRAQQLLYPVRLPGVLLTSASSLLEGHAAESSCAPIYDQEERPYFCNCHVACLHCCQSGNLHR